MSNDYPQIASELASPAATKSIPNLLEGYLCREELAQAIGLSARTIDRYERLKIGPPRVVIGGLVLYRIESVRAWLLSAEKQPSHAKQPASHRWTRSKKGYPK